MSSANPEGLKPAAAKGWDSLPPELHLAIFREFLALEEHVKHHYPDFCSEILETPSNCDLSACSSWNMYSSHNAIAHLDTPADQNTSKCDACVDINSSLTVCRSWNALLKDQILRRLPLELIIYKGSASLAAIALHRWTTQTLKSTDGHNAQLPWVSDYGTDLLAVALRRGLPDCISPLVNLLPRQTVTLRFGSNWFEYRCYAHVAAASGNVDVLRLLKFHGFGLHQEDTRGRTPVCIAIRCNNISAVEYLLSIEKPRRGLDHNALSFATCFGSISAVWLIAQHLLNSCQTPEEKVNVYMVVFLWSLRRLDLSASDEAVTYLLEQLPGKHLVSMGPEYVITAIRHGACVTLLKHIIEKGANVNVSSLSRMEAPLQTAIERGDRDIIRLLLDSGAKCTPHVLCLPSTSAEILELLVTYYVYRDRDLYQRVNIGNAAVVKRLLGFGRNPNPSTEHGNALQVAVIRESLDIAQMLLEAGANPNHFVDSPTTKWGTPLYIATINGNIPLMKLLLQHGADMTNCSCRHEESVLHVAVNRGDIPAIKILVDHDDGYRDPRTKTTTLDSRDKLEMLRLVLKERLEQLPPDASDLA